MLYNRDMDIFSALAEPTRRTIVELLASRGPLPATEIYEQFHVSHPAISQHLKVLREANVVRMEKRAQQHVYRLNPDALFALEGWASHVTHLWNQRFDVLERVLEEEKKNLARRNSMARQDFKRKEVTITRLFDAPRELVFKAWINPEVLARWWGPHEFTSTVRELDARPGGAFCVDMRGPDGVMYPGKGVFHEIVEPDRLVFTSSAFEDADGNPQLEVLNTVTFTELDGKTKLTLQAVVMKATPEVDTALAGMEEGWNQSLDHLARELAKT